MQEGIDKTRLLAKYSKMLPKDLEPERDYWIGCNAGWEQNLAFAQERKLDGVIITIREAIASNQETIDFIDYVLGIHDRKH